MTNINKICVVWIYAKDLQKTRKFYEEAVGLKFEF